METKEEAIQAEERTVYERINNEPVIFRGLSSSELMTGLIVTLMVLFPVCLFIGYLMDRILVGLGLLAVEVAMPGGIILLFFGVSAMIVGVLVALGLGGPPWFQVLLFSLLSVVSLLTLRGPILRRVKRRLRRALVKINHCRTIWTCCFSTKISSSA